jgi:hypothetical protein
MTKVKSTARSLDRRRQRQAVDRAFERAADCYFIFAGLAQKYGFLETKACAKFFGFSQKDASALLRGDLTRVTWRDYISCAAKIIHYGLTLEAKARSKYGS